MPAIATLCVVLMLAGSLGVWAIVISRWNRGWPALSYRERPAVDLGAGTVVAAALLWVFSQFIAGLSYAPVSATLESVKFATLVNALTFVLVFGLLDFGWGRSRLPDLGLALHDPLAETATGVCGFLASILPVLAVLVATYPIRSESQQHSFLQFLRSDSSIEAIGWIVAAVCILAPLTEELLFRVVLQGSLQTRFRPEIAIGISSAIFASIHNWPDSIALLPLAVILGYIFHRRNSYVAVVVLHALFNLSNLMLSLLTENVSRGRLESRPLRLARRLAAVPSDWYAPKRIRLRDT